MKKHRKARTGARARVARNQPKARRRRSAKRRASKGGRASRAELTAKTERRIARLERQLVTVKEGLHSRDEELNRTNSDLDNLFSSVQMAIVMVSRDLRIRRFAPLAEKLFDLVASDIGQSISDIKTSLVMPDLRELLASVIDNGVTRELEVEDTRGHWHLLRVRPSRSRQNAIDGAVIALVDIDALKHDREALSRQGRLLEQAREAMHRRAEEFAAADRRKNEFVAMLAHELRNPLAPLRNAVEILRNPAKSVEDTARTQDLIDRQITKMARLVDDLLDASRVTRGQIQLRKEPLDLRQVVQRAAQTTLDMIRARNQQLAVGGADQPLIVDADPVRLEQVFANLLDNASKYSPDRGTISVSLGLGRDEADPVRPMAVVRVRDDGIGIEEEMLPRVFDLFSQADRSLARTQGGLGIGLSLVKSLVDLHGGRVTAQSDGANHGSVFTVYLPAI